MKKLLTTTIAGLALTSTLLTANTSVGLVADLGIGIGAQFDDKINAFIGSSGISGDYLFINNKKMGDSPFNWYLGGGLAYYFSDWGADSGDFDVRLPVGIEWDFHKEWDAFLQATPALRIGDDVGFGIGAAIGVRYKF